MKMHAKILGLLVGAAAVVSGAKAQETAVDAEDIPVKPIPASQHGPWTNAFRLQNDAMEVVVAPAAGRIVVLRFGQSDNLLRAADPPPDSATNTWANLGGDWLWPVAQSHWDRFQDGDWPPSRLLDGRPWTGSAWKNANGSLCCLISQDYGAPLHLRVSRLIKLDSEKARVSVRQRIERTADSDVPVTLWNISQLGGADTAVLPTDPASRFPPGYGVLMFDPPGDRFITPCPDAVVYGMAAGGEHKLCSDSERAWIAARKGKVVLIERTLGDSFTGEYPDGGCRVELYANAGLGYLEIETLSREVNLKQGESTENTLYLECFLAQEELAPCELAERVMEHLGERK